MMEELSMDQDCSGYLRQSWVIKNSAFYLSTKLMGRIYIFKKWYNGGRLWWTVSGSHPLLGILNTFWWTLCSSSCPSQLSCYFYLSINKETVRGLNAPIWHGLWEADWVLKTKFLQIGKPVTCLRAHFVQKFLKSLMEFRTLKISGSH